MGMLDVSAGVFISGTKVLAFQKGEAKYPYMSYKYEFPGGKIEKGESPEQALIRELKEELNLDISKNKIEFLCETEHEYPDFTIRLHTFLIFTDGVEFTLKEHRNASWSEIDDLWRFDWAEADKDVVRCLMDRAVTLFINH